MELKYKKEDETRYGEEYEFIDMINVKELHTTTIDILNKYGDTFRLDEANDVANTLIQLLKHKKLITDNTHQSFVDVLLSACMIHNLFYDKEDFTTLFKTRKELASVMEKAGINKQISEAIFSTVEGQLGEDSPVESIKPNPNTPTELFSFAIWITKHYIC